MRPLSAGGSRRRLAEFTLAEKLGFVSGWLPPGQGDTPRPPWAGCRWQTWAEYLHDFAQVEAELRQRRPRHIQREPFAALARAYQRQHGAAALARASYGQIRQHGEVEP